MSRIKKIFQPSSYRTLKHYYDKGGVRLVGSVAKKKIVPYNVKYRKWYEQYKPTEQELEQQRNHKFDYSPKFSIITPLYDVPINYFDDLYKSLKDQTYSNWELCLADGSKDNSKIIQYLDTLQESRIKYKKLESNKGIAGNTNEAANLATGDYLIFVDQDDVLPCQALYEVTLALQDEKYDVLYSDEDMISADLKKKSDPVFKPDYSPDLLMSHNYITHLFVIKRTYAKKIGCLHSKYDGAQDYDFVLRATSGTDKIHHIPEILYHWRMHKGSVADGAENKKYAYDAGKQALEAHLKRIGVKAKVEHMPLLGFYHVCYTASSDCLLSIIIPNMDHIEDLGRCITSIYEKSIYKKFEIIIVENNSKNKETFDLYEKIQTKYDNLKVVEYKGHFNFSAINNFAIEKASGDYLLFLNNDTELISPNGIDEMLGICCRDDVGAVGAKLLYEDDTIQHAGIVIGFGDWGGFAGPVFTKFPKDDPGYMLRPMLNCNYSAVTGACLMVSKEDFDKVNGFSEEFEVGLNDVDLCLKIRNLGKYIVYNAHSLWYHYESKSRGLDADDPKKTARLKKEVKLLQSRRPDIFREGDPFYNKNFPLNDEPFKFKIQCC